jgi:hypothetical protein
MTGDCSFTIACHVDSEFTTLKITLSMGDFLYSEKSQFLVRMKGLEPSRREAHAPKACVSTNSTTSA